MTCLTLLCFGLGFYVYKNPALRSLEDDAADFFFALRPSPRADKIAEVVLVMVDNNSLRERFGYYDPIPRRYLAEIVDTLSARGAKLISLDIAFFDKQDALDPTGDTLLQNSFRRAKNVVAVSAYEPDESGSLRLRVPHPFFRQALRGSGFANLKVSSVGGLATVRSVPPFAIVGADSLVPSFSTLVYCLSEGIDLQRYLNAQVGNGPSNGFERIPLDDGSMVINFVGPPPVWLKNTEGTWTQEKEGRIIAYRSGAVTSGSVQKVDAFDGKVVFVGSFSEFSLDQFITPYYGLLFESEPMRGVEVQANAFLTLLHNRFFRLLPDSWILFLLAALALITVFTTSRFRLLGDLLTIGGELTLIWGIGYVCFAHYNYWLPAVSMSLTVVFSYFATTVHSALTEQKEKKRITGVFGQYVDERVVEQLIEHPEMSRIGGVNREVTLLFSDLKGFTKLSERLGAENIVKLMNIYLTEMTDIIQRNEGTIDKFIGDSIMAFWGAPLPNPEAPYLACLSALQMQTRLEEMKDRWREFGDVEVQQRIGINTGVCIVGNVGSVRKTNYTAIGDAVNLASRLEGVNKRYGTSILISQYTRSNVADRFTLREIEDVIVQGKTEPVKVYELRGRLDGLLPPREKSFLEFYDRGLSAFKNSDWDAAAELFECALKESPEDQVGRIFLERIKQLRSGSFRH